MIARTEWSALCPVVSASPPSSEPVSARFTTYHGAPSSRPAPHGDGAVAKRLPAGHQGEHDRDDERECEHGVELRREGESERKAPERQFRAGTAGKEHDGGQEERRDHQVVQDRGAVEQDDGERREHEPAVRRGRARQSQPACEEDDREQARPERRVLRERTESLRAREHRRQVETDLGDGRVPIETRVVARGDVADSALLVPQAAHASRDRSGRPSRWAS